MEIASLKSLLVRSTEKYREVLAYQKREDGGYRKITYGRVLELAKAVQKALVNFGVGQGDRVIDDGLQGAEFRIREFDLRLGQFKTGDGARLKPFPFDVETLFRDGQRFVQDFDP